MSAIPLSDPWLMLLAQYAQNEWTAKGRGAVFIADDQWTKPSLEKLDLLYVLAAEVRNLSLSTPMQEQMLYAIANYSPFRHYVLCFYGDILQSVSRIDMQQPIISLGHMINSQTTML